MKDLYTLSGISRQAHWDAQKREAKQYTMEPIYAGLIVEIRELHPSMGLRTMYEQFKPEGIGRDAFIAFGLREGYRLQAVKIAHKTTVGVKKGLYDNLLEGKRFTDINQVWVSDLFYFHLNDKHYYVVLIMDVYSRRIVGYSVADNMRKENNIAALKMALDLRGIDNYNDQLIHHSDRGSQYTSEDYTELLRAHGIAISMCTNVLENAHCERVNGTIKNGYLNAWIDRITNFFQLKKHTGMAVKNYNNRRHHSLKMTPIEYEDYIKELAPDQRFGLEIFTMSKENPDKKKKHENPSQLSLF